MLQITLQMVLISDSPNNSCDFNGSFNENESFYDDVSKNLNKITFNYIITMIIDLLLWCTFTIETDFMHEKYIQTFLHVYQ